MAVKSFKVQAAEAQLLSKQQTKRLKSPENKQ
jgi:hypothetical protein